MRKVQLLTLLSWLVGLGLWGCYEGELVEIDDTHDQGEEDQQSAVFDDPNDGGVLFSEFTCVMPYDSGNGLPCDSSCCDFDLIAGENPFDACDSYMSHDSYGNISSGCNCRASTEDGIKYLNVSCDINYKSMTLECLCYERKDE